MKRFPKDIQYVRQAIFIVQEHIHITEINIIGHTATVFQYNVFITGTECSYIRKN